MISPGNPPLSTEESPYFTRASAAFSRGDLAAARQELGLGLAADRTNPDLWLALGTLQMSVDDLAGAVDSYGEAQRVAPARADVHALGALALKLHGKSREAKGRALAALAIEPSCPMALKVLARVQLDWGNADLAVGYCDAVLAMDASDEDAILIRRQCVSAPVAPSLPAPGKGPGYDAYISLGSNCEPGLQFRRIGYQESSFFRFTFSPFAQTLAAIGSDFAGVYERRNLVPHTDGMVHDTASGITFHSDLRSAVDPRSGKREYLRTYDFDEVYGLKDAPKIRHLVAKWHALAQSRQQVVYFLKLDGGHCATRAAQMAALLRRKYPDHLWTLVCLQDEDPLEQDWKIPGVINRYLSRFAPIGNAHDADLAAWDRIFAEFPLRKRSSLTRQAARPLPSLKLAS